MIIFSGNRLLGVVNRKRKSSNKHCLNFAIDTWNFILSGFESTKRKSILARENCNFFCYFLIFSVSVRGFVCSISKSSSEGLEMLL